MAASSFCLRRKKQVGEEFFRINSSLQFPQSAKEIVALLFALYFVLVTERNQVNSTTKDWLKLVTFFGTCVVTALCTPKKQNLIHAYRHFHEAELKTLELEKKLSSCLQKADFRAASKIQNELRYWKAQKKLRWDALGVN